MPRQQNIMIILFCLILVVPPLQMLLNFIPEPKLTGVATDSELPVFSWKELSTGKIQKGFEKWFNQHMGLRPYAIRIDSQINLSLFGESSIKTADVPIIGKNNFIYARVYIDEFNRRRSVEGFAPEKIARNMRRLQDALQKRGKGFLFVIGPSKAEIYPEYISPRFLDSASRSNASCYTSLITALHREGVWTVDGHALFLEQKQKSPWLLFPPGGIHWLSYGASLVVEQMTRELEAQIGRPMVHIECEMISAGAPSEAFGETDIALLLNTWSLPRWDVQVPRPRFYAREEGNVYRPRLLLVGDSFAFGLIDLMQRYKVHEGLDLYYYYSKRYQYPGGSVQGLRKESFDWEKELFARDAVIIEINEVQLNPAWGFVSDALKHLDARSKDDAKERNEPDGN